MMQIIEQTKEEKVAMYMKCPKKQLAEMLWACNVLIETMSPKVTISKENILTVGRRKTV